jgi:hypothetical protein
MIVPKGANPAAVIGVGTRVEDDIDGRLESRVDNLEMEDVALELIEGATAGAYGET